jgi:hypothetical protein
LERPKADSSTAPAAWARVAEGASAMSKAAMSHWKCIPSA